MARFLVMADGPDEPGIVASVTEALAAHSCNLEDTAMTRLGGRFAMLLMVVSEGAVNGEELLDVLSAATENMDMHIGIDWLTDEDPAMEVVTGDRWSISV